MPPRRTSRIGGQQPPQFETPDATETPTTQENPTPPPMIDTVTLQAVVSAVVTAALAGVNASGTGNGG